MEKNAQRPYQLQEELKLLDPASIRLYLDEFEDLNLELEDGSVLGPVKALRAFPITAADDFVAVKDSDGEELGVIQKVADLDPASRKVLEAELERVYFRPRITRIVAIVVNFRIPTWEVETDRGGRIFEIGSMRSDFRPLEAGRILIHDVDGNRYEIPDYRKLDPFSRALVEGQI